MNDGDEVYANEPTSPTDHGNARSDRLTIADYEAMAEKNRRNPGSNGLEPYEPDCCGD